MFQMGGIGPMLGQAHHFRIYAPEKIEYAINRYTNEAKRLYGVLDKRLSQSAYLAGDEYTIADIATFPWTRSWKNQGIDWADFPHAKRWFDAIAERPAVQRGVATFAKERKELTDDKAREVLYGSTQYAKR
jgi:GSH-dependent disulfide-bond oxidoreductase